MTPGGFFSALFLLRLSLAVAAQNEPEISAGKFSVPSGCTNVTSERSDDSESNRPSEKIFKIDVNGTLTLQISSEQNGTIRIEGNMGNPLTIPGPLKETLIHLKANGVVVLSFRHGVVTVKKCLSDLNPSIIPEDVMMYEYDKVSSPLPQPRSTYLHLNGHGDSNLVPWGFCSPVQSDSEMYSAKKSALQVCVVLGQGLISSNRSSPLPGKTYELIPLRSLSDKEGPAFATFISGLNNRTENMIPHPCLLPDVVLPVKCQNFSDTGIYIWHVTKLDLSSMGFQGEISQSIAKFSHLQELVLANNEIRTSKESNLTSPLESLDWSNNSLQVLSLPVHMPHLKELHLDNNKLGESIQSPQEFRRQLGHITSLASLQQLTLANNSIRLNFNETFYEGFDNLTLLNILGNDFTGEIDRDWVANTSRRICARPGNSGLQNAHDCRDDNYDHSLLPDENEKIGMFMGIAAAAVAVIAIMLFLGLRQMKKSRPRVVPKKCARERPGEMQHSITGRGEEPLCHFLLDGRLRGAGSSRVPDIVRQASAKGTGFLRKPKLQFTELPWKLTVEDIDASTNSFETLLGKGSFGDVFEGTIDTHSVAVKFRAKTASTTVLNSFQKDVENMISLNHENLAKVLGFCDCEYYQALVIEYFPKGSLEDHLHGDHVEQAFLNTWGRRLKIMVDAARAIEYIHGECSFFPKRSSALQLHGNIKSSNVLIEDELNAKVTDFGVYGPKLFGDKSHSDLNLFFAGYLDPDYLRDESRKEVDKKSDVYSLGVVLLEVITGKTPIVSPRLGETPLHIREWVQETKGSGGIDSVIDARMVEAPHSIESLTMALELALWCTEMNPSSRPNIKQVKHKLVAALRSENISSKSKTHIELQVPVSDEV